MDEPTQYPFFIGTQGDAPGEGIFHGTLDRATGRLASLGLAAEVRRPTWLEVDARRRWLFATSELGNKSECDGEVLSFAMAAGDRPLRPIGRASSGGGGPTHLCPARDGRLIYAANFGGGQACALPVAPDGSLGAARLSAPHAGSGPHPRQNRPHPHGVTLAPGGRHLLVPDMGNDQVVIHSLDAGTGHFEAGAPRTCAFPAGSGPRLLLFSANGQLAFLLSELSAELFVLRWASEPGSLEILHRCPLDQPGAEGAPSAAALVMSADGKHLYASNRRSGSIAVFAVDQAGGPPKLIQDIDSGGSKPWGAAQTLDGRWLLVANQGSNSVAAFRVSSVDGTLVLAAAGPISVPSPTHVVFTGIA